MYIFYLLVHEWLITMVCMYIYIYLYKHTVVPFLLFGFQETRCVDPSISVLRQTKVFIGYRS